MLELRQACSRGAARLHPCAFSELKSNPDWSAIATPFYEKLWTCTLDTVPDEALRGYDVVVLADVLEHMPVPKIPLDQIGGITKPGLSIYHLCSECG